MDSELSVILEEIKSLPYGRNSDRSDYTLVPTEKKGSCSTKHAYIRSIATQKGWENVKLILCIYLMNADNTPGVAQILSKYQLTEIPEAHTYLEIDGILVDVTGLANGLSSFENSIVQREEIQPEQIGDYKVSYHKEFISRWSNTSVYSTTELWEIREECIQALSIW
jgi:hypothetical protein